MTKLRLIHILATLALAASVCALVTLGLIAAKTGLVHWVGFAGSLTVLVGAGTRLRKSSAFHARPD